MRARLARLAPRQALGVYVDERELTVSHVAATPLGPVEISRRSEPYEGDQLRAVLVRTLDAVRGRRRPRRLAVALGLPAQRVFFSTRPIRTTDTEASAQVLLQEVLQAPALATEDMAVDLLKVQPGKRKLASIVACRKKYLVALLGHLDGCRLRLVRAEPEPCALLRLALARQRTPRRTGTVLHCFLGAGRGLAVVTAAGQPLLWRYFPLPAGEEAAAVCSVARALHVMTGPCGSEAPPELAWLHGRPDLHGPLEAQGLGDQLGLRCRWSKAPGLDKDAVAYGLAVGALARSADGFDLARLLKPPPSLRELFPWGEVAVQAALLLCMGLFLNFHLEQLRASCRRAEAESDKHAWLAAVPDARLNQEKKDLEEKLAALQRFLDSRVVWTTCLQDLPARLPEHACLVSLAGACELPDAGKAAVADRSLVLKAVVPTPGQGSPPEITELVAALQHDRLLGQDFPEVKVGEMRQPPRVQAADR